MTDYRDGNRPKAMHLDGEEFVRRFLLHILPKGLIRIRHFGFLANRCRPEKLARIRRVLALAKAIPASCIEATGDEMPPSYPCPQCKQRQLYVIAQLPP